MGSRVRAPKSERATLTSAALTQHLHISKNGLGSFLGLLGCPPAWRVLKDPSSSGSSRATRLPKLRVPHASPNWEPKAPTLAK